MSYVKNLKIQNRNLKREVERHKNRAKSAVDSYAMVVSESNRRHSEVKELKYDLKVMSDEVETLSRVAKLTILIAIFFFVVSVGFGAVLILNGVS